MANWGEVLAQIQNIKDQAQATHTSAVDLVRRDYLNKLHEHSGRNIIAYYSGWLSKPDTPSVDINDEDKNGFMMAVHGLDRSLGLDLILHTPGGSIGATHSLVDYLRRMFKDDIRAIVPQIAMSAGTMIACCCKEILMAKHSNLGPIDPHIGGLPAMGIIEEFKTACKQIKKDPSTIPLWQAIIGQYQPALLSRCENAISWSNDFVRGQLEKVMFADRSDAAKVARAVVSRLSDYSDNRTHERHLHYDECKEIGLNVRLIEDDNEFQNLVLTVHHCYMHSLQNTGSYKMIENHKGRAFVKKMVIRSELA